MRRFLFVIMMVMLAGCGVTRYADGSPDSEKAEAILHDYYPQLYEYYIEDVLRVNSLRRVTLADGTIDYQVRYRLVRYYYPTYAARISAVETYLPELFDLYRHGMVNISSVWKYVDPSTGRIMHQAKYQWIYNYYPYGPYYGGTYYYGGRRRVRPLPPPRPRRSPEAKQPHNDRPPQNRPGPGGRPRVQPDQKPQAQPGSTNPPTKPGGGQGTQQRNSRQSRSSVSRSSGSSSVRSGSGSSRSSGGGSNARSSSGSSSTRSGNGGRR